MCLLACACVCVCVCVLVCVSVCLLECMGGGGIQIQTVGRAWVEGAGPNAAFLRKAPPPPPLVAWPDGWMDNLITANRTKQKKKLNFCTNIGSKKKQTNKKVVRWIEIDNFYLKIGQIWVEIDNFWFEMCQIWFEINHFWFEMCQIWIEIDNVWSNLDWNGQFLVEMENFGWKCVKFGLQLTIFGWKLVKFGLKWTIFGWNWPFLVEIDHFWF